MNDEQLLDAARAVFRARTVAEAGAAVADVPDMQIPRVAELAGAMEARRVEALAAIDNLIGERGHVVQLVMATDTTPWFAYTAGLYPEYPAEIIARGFGEFTSDVVSAAVRWVAAGFIRLAPGDYMLPEGGAVRVVPWAGPFENVAMAIRHHRSRGCHSFPVMHIVVADDEGRLPGEPGCTVAKHQLRGLPGHPT